MTSDNDRYRTDQPQTLSAFLIVDGDRLITLAQDITTIGRKADNHIIIKHEFVSRHHARIYTRDGHFIIEDLNSTVGTSVNGVRIQSTSLQAGDVISLGGAPIIFGLGTPRSDFDANSPGKLPHIDSGPTQASDLQDADQYLDFFKPHQD